MFVLYISGNCLSSLTPFHFLLPSLVFAISISPGLVVYLVSWPKLFKLCRHGCSILNPVSETLALGFVPSLPFIRTSFTLIVLEHRHSSSYWIVSITVRAVAYMNDAVVHMCTLKWTFTSRVYFHQRN